MYYEAKANRLVDAYVTDGYVKPTDDKIQDWTLIDSIKTSDGFIIFEAERALDIGDTVHDREVVDDSGPSVADHRLIGAWGDSEMIDYHFGDRITTSVQLFPGGEGSGSAYDTFQKQMAKLSEGSTTLVLEHYEVPSDKVNTYERRCFTTADLVNLGLLRDSTSDTHVLGFEFHIEETIVKYVHHMMVHGHIMELNDNENECNDSSTVPIMGWAPGSDFYHFPEGAGLQVGDVPGSFNAFTIEYHFYNVDLDKNIIDNGSGVTLYFTNQPVETEIGMVVVGDPRVQLIHESVGNGKTMHSFTCSASCTQSSFKDDEIIVIQEGLHMHQNGKRITNQMFRGGMRMNEAFVDFWDFDLNGISIVRQNPYKMKKGDYFRTSCYYDNDRNTTFGLESQDEMCMVFLYYYPKQPSFYGCGYGLDGPCGADYAKKTLSSDSNFGREFATITNDGDLGQEAMTPSKSPTPGNVLPPREEGNTSESSTRTLLGTSVLAVCAALAVLLF